MPEIRYLTPEGRLLWQQWVSAAKIDSAIAPPVGLLDNPDFTRRAPGGGVVEQKLYTTKIALAQGLAPALQKVRDARLKSDHWPGLWDWLALLHLDSICPKAPGGKRKLKHATRYCYDPAWNRKYRHRIYGPLDLYTRLGNSAQLLIHGRADSLTDWEEQTASRYQISANKGIADALFELYWDQKKCAPKRGAAPNSKKPGTLRRFGDLVLQLDRTFDLMSIGSSAILDLLPGEFARFRA